MRSVLHTPPAETPGRHCNNKGNKRHRHPMNAGGVRQEEAENQFPSRNDFSLSDRLG